MNNRDKIAHLLRRLGFGAGDLELAVYEPLGVDGTIDRLIQYQTVEEEFPVSVWEFAVNQADRLPNLDPKRVAAWWLLRMICTKRPLQEKLTLFWHDHFAVSASKVDRGPLMHLYLETLRANANGNFMDLLKAMNKDPAMILWLDTNTNVKGKPNENYAREVMELFTMGVGNYTETDILEAARAFTGWTFVPAAGIRRQRPTEEELVKAIEENKPLFEFRSRPQLHDDGIKRILGNEGKFDGDDVAGILVSRPETAKFITTKLWEWFAYPNPEPAVQERLAKTYIQSGFDIKKILYAIVQSPEFWSEKCVQKQVKNPVDFTVGICRAIDLGTYLLKKRETPTTPLTPISREIQGIIRNLYIAVANQGMELLYPPDVAGWEWGVGWITSATMVERIKLSSLLFRNVRANDLIASVAAQISNLRPIRTSKDIVDAVCVMFDAAIPDERMKSLTVAVDAAGGISALSGRRNAALLENVTKALFAAPEFHLC